tara:strand:- start:5920 stop:7416 length:1497 start_codon:yes stop_codon:yes gene_type:complete
MGIPSYYKNIIQSHPDVVSDINDKNSIINNLFFDLNCAIHPCCANKTDEKLMMDAIYEKIIECISITDVKDFIYIAIDGPAPRTKMEQQRCRRLKSSQENKIWDTNQITPGTKFMNQLNLFLKEKIKTIQIKTILSDSNEPGEGEHKIMKIIDGMPMNSINVVYGLDADLIMLSMIRKHSILLLRERTEYNIEDIDCNYIYLDVTKLKGYLIETIKKDYFKIDNTTILHDYLFLCFFIGNDFIINSPCLNIRYNGINSLLHAYQELQIEFKGRFFLQHKLDIHLTNLKLFLNKIASVEKQLLQDIIQRRDKQEKYIRKRFHIDTSLLQKPSDIDKYNPKDLNISEKMYSDYKLNIPILFRENEKDIIQNKYYLYTMFSTLNYNPSYDQLIKYNKKLLCEEYLNSILWTFHYYFKECISWKWYYKYHYAPFIKDLYEYMIPLKSLSFTSPLKNDKPFTPKEQLRIVLPNQQNTYYYPKKTPLFYLMKRFEWECHPILPH